MAQFYAISEADIVGSTNHKAYPASFVAAANVALESFTGPLPGTNYTIYNFNAPVSATASISSFTNFTTPSPFVTFGAGAVNHVWKADSGDSYLFGTPGAASTDTFAGLVRTSLSGAPTQTHGTEQQINQFFFKFDDSIHGSDEDDKLCGWAGDDQMWGNLGDDEFYYGEGMGIDKIMDCDKNDDSVIFDTDLYENFRQLRKDATFGNGKVKIKVDSDEKLYIYGIETRKELKAVADFDDFTDFQ